MSGASSYAPYSAIIGPAESKVFFLDAPGGTGKTFNMRAVQDLLLFRQREVVTVATSALADSEQGRDLIQADVILWDEIDMCSRRGVKAVDKILRDIPGVNKQSAYCQERQTGRDS